MTREAIRAALLAALVRVAPEADPEALRFDLPLRDQVDIDSMDFLNFLLEIHQALGVDVSETDYHEFTTLEGAVAYLATHVAAPDAASPATGAA